MPRAPVAPDQPGAADRPALPTRDRLVGTARTYLDSQGLDGIGLREIARCAGLSHGAPLRHFPTLASLLAAVAAAGFRDLYASVDEAVRAREASAPRARLAAAAHGYFAFARAHPGVFGLIFRRDLCDTNDADYLTAGGMAFGQLVALVADAQATGWQQDRPPAEVAAVVWGAVHGLASLHLHGVLTATSGVSDPEELVTLMTELVIEAEEST